MSKIRKLEITETGNKYTISVGGEKGINVIKDMVIDLKDYQKELAHMEQNIYVTNDSMDRIVSIIMKEINYRFNLSKDEYREYAQTLKYILKD